MTSPKITACTVHIPAGTTTIPCTCRTLRTLPLAMITAGATTARTTTPAATRTTTLRSSTRARSCTFRTILRLPCQGIRRASRRQTKTTPCQVLFNSMMDHHTREMSNLSFLRRVRHSQRSSEIWDQATSSDEYDRRGGVASQGPDWGGGRVAMAVIREGTCERCSEFILW